MGVSAGEGLVIHQASKAPPSPGVQGALESLLPPLLRGPGPHPGLCASRAVIIKWEEGQATSLTHAYYWPRRGLSFLQPPSLLLFILTLLVCGYGQWGPRHLLPQFCPHCPLSRPCLPLSPPLHLVGRGGLPPAGCRPDAPCTVPGLKVQETSAADDFPMPVPKSAWQLPLGQGQELPHGLARWPGHCSCRQIL